MRDGFLRATARAAIEGHFSMNHKRLLATAAKRAQSYRVLTMAEKNLSITERRSARNEAGHGAYIYDAANWGEPAA